MISVLTVTKRIDRLILVEKSLARQSFQDFEWVVETSTDKPEDYKWAFNRAMNKGIKRCKGDLIVSIQDSIWFTPEALFKFNFYNGLVSGVGDQYDELDENGKPRHKVWEDPRKTDKYGTYYECEPNDWELNFASFPKKAIEEIGGFDEEMDKWYGYDNVAVAYRLAKLGYKFYLDQTNESFTLRHERNPDWDKDNWINHGFEEFVNERGVKLDYLP